MTEKIEEDSLENEPDDDDEYCFDPTVFYMEQLAEIRKETTRLKGAYVGDRTDESFQDFILLADCLPGTTEAVLSRAREIFLLLNRYALLWPDGWPGDDQWAAILPGWLLEPGEPPQAPPPSSLKARLLSYFSRSKLKYIDPGFHDLANFAYSFQPSARRCYWQNAALENHRIRAFFRFQDSFPSDSLFWLFRKAGACKVLFEIDLTGGGAAGEGGS